jgi:hypothetical protein
LADEVRDTTADAADAAEVSFELPGIDETCRVVDALSVALGRLVADEAGRDIGMDPPDADACDAAGRVLFPAGEGGSSSSESESSLSEDAPTVDGLLEGESGLSGPSSSSSGAATVLVVGFCRRTRLGKTVTGDGRRS